MQPRFWMMLLVIYMTAASRLVDHPWNFAPMGALALFCGAHLRSRVWAFALPILAAFAGDLALGLSHQNVGFYTFHALAPAVYLSYALSVAIGFAVRRAWSRERVTPNHSKGPVILRRVGIVASATLAGSLTFYFVTNFFDWLLFDTYAHTPAGLWQCYVSAIPFFRTTLAGDLLYVAIFFGGYELRKAAFPVAEAEPDAIRAD